MSARVAALALVGALTGCSLGPPYERPELDVPATFRGQETSANEKSFSDLAWWEIYHDPMLQALLRRALAHNRDAKIAAARVEEARAQAGITRLAQLPQIDANGSALRGRVFQGGHYATGAIFGAQGQVSFELDVWRRLASVNEAARANLLASAYGQEAVRVSLIGDVASAYFSLLSLDEQLRITLRTVAARERFAQLTQSKFNRGASSNLDVNRAQANLAAARANLPDLQRQIAQLENQLHILLGENPADVKRETIDLQTIPTPPEVPAGLPSSLLDRRPDLEQAENALAAAHANVHAAKAALFPSIALTGSLGTESLELSKLFSGPTKVWSLGVNLLQPLLDAQRSGFQVEAARAREEQALLQYQNAVANAFREVSDALAARAGYAESVRVQEDQVRALTEASRRVLRRYEVGYSSYFEVIEADSALFVAELQLAQARRNNLVAMVQLYKALGGGWEREAGMAAVQP